MSSRPSRRSTARRQSNDEQEQRHRIDRGARIRGRRTPAVADVHGARVPRVLDVRDPRSCAAAYRRRPEAGAAPHHLRDERARPCRHRQAQEVGAHGRRRDRQVPPARRLGLLRSHGADGTAVLVPLSDRGRAGQLRLAGRPEVVRGDALHRVEALALRRSPAVRAGPGHRGLAAQLRRLARRAAAVAGAPAEPAAERRDGHRRGHVHRHSAAQPARSRGRLHSPARRAEGDDGTALRARARARISRPVRKSSPRARNCRGSTKPATAPSVPVPGSRSRTARSS